MDLELYLLWGFGMSAIAVTIVALLWMLLTDGKRD